MSQRRRTNSDDDMLPEYDFTGAVRGKYYERYRQGTAVNDALRLLVSLAEVNVPQRRTEAHEPHLPNKATHQTRPKAARR